jgi:glutathione synthase
MDDGNLASLFELFTGVSREPLIVQKYLPDGDARRQAGDPGGRRLRGARSTGCPPKGETRSNMHVGGRPEPWR